VTATGLTQVGGTADNRRRMLHRIISVDGRTIVIDEGVVCKDCCHPVPLYTPRTLCPKCGCTLRHQSVTLVDVLTITDASLKGRHKDTTGFLKSEFERRRKTAGESGRPADEILSIDRTRPDVTIKRHQVWEIDERGERRLVHDEECHYPAKRRSAAAPEQPAPDEGDSGDDARQ